MSIQAPAIPPGHPQAGLHTLLQAGVHPSLSEAFGDTTLMTIGPAWAASLRGNLPVIWERGKQIVEIGDSGGKDVLVMGGGPSMWDNLELVKQFDGVKICCLRQLPEILKAGVVPDFAVCVDSHPLYAAAAGDPEVVKVAESGQVKAVFNTLISPLTVKAWKGEIFWFNSALGGMPMTPKDLDFWIGMLTGMPTMPAAGCAGNTGWILAYNLGAPQIVCLGLDFAWKMESDEALVKTAGAIGLQCIGPAPMVRWETNVFGNRVVTNLGYQSLRDSLHMMYAGLRQRDETIRAQQRAQKQEPGWPMPQTIQCSEWTTWHTAPGLRVCRFSEYLDDPSGTRAKFEELRKAVRERQEHADAVRQDVGTPRPNTAPTCAASV